MSTVLCGCEVAEDGGVGSMSTVLCGCEVAEDGGVGSMSTVLCGCEVAEDGGVGSVAAYARLSVQVVDVNDNSPELLVNAAGIMYHQTPLY